MIKFLGTGEDGRPLYGFGLSAGNCKLLVEGKPILIDLDEMAPWPTPEGRRGAVLLFGGQTEQDMVGELKRHGLVKPDTPVHTHHHDDEQPKGAAS